MFPEGSRRNNDSLNKEVGCAKVTIVTPFNIDCSVDASMHIAVTRLNQLSAIIWGSRKSLRAMLVPPEGSKATTDKIALSFQAGWPMIRVPPLDFSTLGA